MLAARPAATVIGQRYKATDVNGGTLYESIDGSTWVQMAPGITEASAEATRATAAEGVNATNIATNTTAITSEASTARAAEALKAPLASPTFTGTAPVIPDAAAATHAMNRQSSDARLAPLVNRVVVPAGAMLAVSATATYAANVTPVWSMPASVSWVMAAIELPAHWATFKISVRYVNLVATAGNVVFRPDTNVSADGDTIARTQQSSVTDAAPAQNVPKTTQLYTGLSVAAAGLGVHAITVNRLGGSGADTLAGAIGLLSLIFEKVTP
jgi:hypothetical protein